jgi:hypothetical protein
MKTPHRNLFQIGLFTNKQVQLPKLHSVDLYQSIIHGHRGELDHYTVLHFGIVATVVYKIYCKTTVL